jgi:hypothetical protein
MKLLIAGDFCQKNRVYDTVKNRNYSLLFDDVKDVIHSADYSIVNFEFPIVKENITPSPLSKCGPNLKGTIEAVSAVKYAGFKCCALANNHILDQGEDCCIDTREALLNGDVDVVGAGANLYEAEQILYKTISGIKIAIINCCEHEFSIATPNSAGAAPLNPIKQYYQIKEACKQSDYVVVIVHGGHEHFQLPSSRMQETYHFFVDAGADVVVNGHQHCYSGYEIYNKKPIFYGIGNFCFDYPQRVDMPWNEGYMVELSLEKGEDIKYLLIPYIQCNKEPGVRLLQDDKLFQDKLLKLNEIISSPAKLENELRRYYLKGEERSLDFFQPHYGNKVLYWLYRHNILPGLISKKQFLKVWNILECESHRDKYCNIFKNKFNS